MCLSESFEFNFELPNGETYTRLIKKPLSLIGLCVNCSKYDKTIKKKLDRLVLQDIYQENCKLLKEIKNIEIDPSPDNKKIEHVIKLNMILREFLALKIMDEEKTIYWDNITIICPNFKNKNILKEKIKYIKNIDEIKSLFLDKEVVISTKKKNINIIINNYYQECQICFNSFKDRKSLCKICKNPEICEMCELETKNKYNRCPFCNMNY